MEIKYTFEFKDLIIITLTGITLYLALKNRRNPIREDLHKRQIDLIIEIMGMFAEVDSKIDEYLLNTELNEQEILKVEITKLLDQLFLLVEKAEIILPDNEYLTIINHFRTINKHFAGVLNDIDDQGEDLLDIQIDFADKMREYIGVEKLSKETRSIIKARYY